MTLAVGRALAGTGALPARAVAVLSAERHRWALWLPFFLGLGVATYFRLPMEPSVWLAPALLAAAVVFGVAFRNDGWGLPIGLIVGMVALGLGSAQLRTTLVAEPQLLSRTGPTAVTGWLVDIDGDPGGRVRLTLSDPVIDDLPAEATPGRVRVSVGGLDRIPPAGSRVSLRAVLLPPGGPVVPGGFDYRRTAFFLGLGAVGYAVGPLDVLGEHRAGSDVWLEARRRSVAAAIRDVLPDPAVAAVAVSLLTGERGGLSDDVQEDLRAAGLAHLLAISGLHLGLVAGLVFFSVRLGLALVPPLALRLPVKRIAASCALLAALGYMLLVGAPVSTQRAFLMTALVLLAVMTDRDPISLRLVAIAALTILVFRPEALMGASFQMSFAAVTALVAAYEAARRHRSRPPGARTWPRRLVVYLVGVAATTVIAWAATAFFALDNFQRVATYGAVSNLVAVPLTAFWIMPLGVLAYLLLPLGLEGVVLVPMGWGIDALLVIADTAAAWPHASLTVAAGPGWALPVAVTGGLWLCLWTRPWRWFGLIGPGVALTAILMATPPHLLVSIDPPLWAVRGSDTLYVSDLRRGGYERDIWLRAVGLDEARMAGPAAGLSAVHDGLTCDSQGCIYRRAGHSAALLTDPAALAEDCGRVDVVVAWLSVPAACAAPVVIDPAALRAGGSHAVTFAPGGIDLRRVADDEFGRPWQQAPPR